MATIGKTCGESCMHNDVCMYKKAYWDTNHRLAETLKNGVGDSIFKLQLICPFYKTTQLTREPPSSDSSVRIGRAPSQYDMETYPK